MMICCSLKRKFLRTQMLDLSTTSTFLLMKELQLRLLSTIIPRIEILLDAVSGFL